MSLLRQLLLSRPTRMGPSADAFRKSHEIEGSTAGVQTDYQVRVKAFYDYSFPDGRFYHLSDRWSPIAGNPTDRHGMHPVHATNIVEVNLVIDGASRRYLAYDAHWDGTEVRLYYTNDLEGTWTEYSANPIIGPLAINNVRTPSVALVGGTLHMFLCHRAQGTIERWTSADGINFVEQEDVIAGLSTGSYHSPFIWLNPNDGEWYLWWRRSPLDGGNAIMARHEADITNLAGEADVVVTSGALYAAYPTVMYRDGKYWLLGERSSNGAPWTVRAYSSDLPTAGFTDCDDSPILVNDEACPVVLLNEDGSKCYLFTNRDSANWYQDMREVYATSLRPYEVSLEGKCKSDFGDVRFRQGETELVYWMESKVDDDNAVFWYVPTIPADPDTVTIHTYYGKADATTTSDGEATFPTLFDHFLGDSLNLTIWNVDALDGSVTIADSIAKVQGNAGAFRYSFSSKAGFRAAQPAAIRFRALIELTVAVAQITQIGFATWGIVGGAYIRSVAGAEQMFVSDSDGNQDNQVIPSAYYDAYFIYDILRNGTEAKGYADDIEIAIGSYAPDTDTIGAQLYCRDSEYDLYCDWILIRKYADPEPAHGDWGSEEAVMWPF